MLALESHRKWRWPRELVAHILEAITLSEVRKAPRVLGCNLVGMATVVNIVMCV